MNKVIIMLWVSMWYFFRSENVIVDALSRKRIQVMGFMVEEYKLV